MSESRMQASRYEFKYLVSEGMARQIRKYVQMQLRPDKFTEGTGGYQVHSLYLDSSDLRLCHQTVCGEKNRFKLRIRFYDDDPSHPVFLEVKRRQTVAVLKKRAMIHRACVNDLLRGFQPKEEYLVSRDSKNVDGLRVFCELAQSIDAQPAAYTSYIREAYESIRDNSKRVTFDRQIRAGTYTGKLTCADSHRWPLAKIEGVVFEMKFTDRFPAWMQELAVIFNLDRISVPKYVECVNLVDERRAASFETARRVMNDSPLSVTTHSYKEPSFRPLPPSSDLSASSRLPSSLG